VSKTDTISPQTRTLQIIFGNTKNMGVYLGVSEKTKIVESRQQRSGLPLTGTGRHMMPLPACALCRAAHGHAKALRT